MRYYPNVQSIESIEKIMRGKTTFEIYICLSLEISSVRISRLFLIKVIAF